MDPVWEQIFAGKEWGKYPSEHVIRFVARNFYHVPERRELKLLEVGCGPGANLWFMAIEGFDVYGIDGSQAAIHTAADRLSQSRLRATLRVGDFCRTLPWADRSFDAVIDNVSLYANPRREIAGALSEIRRVLKVNGKFHSSWFTPATWGYGQGREVEPGGFVDIEEGPLKDRGFCLFVECDDIVELFKEFHIESIETLSWSLHNRQKLISQLVVTAVKR